MRASCAGDETLAQAVVPRCLFLLLVSFALRAWLLPVSACPAATAVPASGGAGWRADGGEPSRGAWGGATLARAHDLCERGLHLVVGIATFLKVRVRRAGVAGSLDTEEANACSFQRRAH